MLNRMWWDLLHNTVFCTAVWLLVSGGMFLLIADIISYQLAIYWDHCTAGKIEEIWKSWVAVEFYNKVLCVMELMMIKKNTVSVPFVF